MSGFARYYELVKPGIIYGNAFTAAAGFLIGGRGATHLGSLLLTLLGLSLVIASGCISNNYYDRGIDARMARTKGRFFAAGGGNAAYILSAAAAMVLLGLAFLASLSLAAAAAAAAGFVIYVFLYTPAKHRTPYAVHIGALAGATPPLVGYFAGGGSSGSVAAALFLMLFLWQIPHFFAIAIYRGEEYSAAGVPVLPRAAGLRRAHIEMACYTGAFLLAAIAPAALGAAGAAYLGAALALSGLWLALAFADFFAADPRRAARRSFFFSLVVLLGTFGTLALSALAL